MADLTANVVNVPQHSTNGSIATLSLTELILGGVEIGVGRQRVDDTITQIGVEAVQHGLSDILSAYRPSETRQTNTTEQELRIATLLFRLYEQGVYGAILKKVKNVGHHTWVDWIQPGAQRVKGLFWREESTLQE